MKCILIFVWDIGSNADSIIYVYLHKETRRMARDILIKHFKKVIRKKRSVDNDSSYMLENHETDVS